VPGLRPWRPGPTLSLVLRRTHNAIDHCSWRGGGLLTLPKNLTPLSAFGLDFRPFRPYSTHSIHHFPQFPLVWIKHWYMGFCPEGLWPFVWAWLSYMRNTAHTYRKCLLSDHRKRDVCIDEGNTTRQDTRRSTIAQKNWRVDCYSRGRLRYSYKAVQTAAGTKVYTHRIVHKS